MSKEAIKLALEALQDIKDDCSGCEFEWSNDYPLQAKAKLALEEALAKQEQGEPVMRVRIERSKAGGLIGHVWWIDDSLVEGMHDLYTTPYIPEGRQQRPSRSDMTWVGLTDDDRKNIHAMWVETDELTDEQDVVDFVEKLLKEKNT